VRPLLVDQFQSRLRVSGRRNDYLITGENRRNELEMLHVIIDRDDTEREVGEEVMSNPNGFRADAYFNS